MSKKLTVNDVAHLLEGNTRIEVMFEDDPNDFYYYDDAYTVEEMMDIFGDRVVTWITLNPDDGEEHLIVELEGKE